MNTHPGSSRVAGRGFTLVELLVVVTIIALLVAITMPSIGSALERSRRARCATNAREIVKACKVYAMDVREHRGSERGILPAVAKDQASWTSGATGNPASLWILVANQYASPGVFICPSLDEYAPAKTSDGRFNVSTLAYSYQSVMSRAVGVLDGDVKPDLVLIGDLNPRFAVDGATSPDATMNQQNSRSHKGAGQNVGRLDEVSIWLDVAKVSGAAGDDWIYHSSGASESQGKPGNVNDVFLAP